MCPISFVKDVLVSVLPRILFRAMPQYPVGTVALVQPLSHHKRTNHSWPDLPLPPSILSRSLTGYHHLPSTSGMWHSNPEAGGCHRCCVFAASPAIPHSALMPSLTRIPP